MIEITTDLNDYRLQGVVSFLAVGTLPATAELYPSPRPALGATPAGSMLASLPLVEPFGTISGGVLTISPTPEALILASGDAAWARFKNGDGTVAWDCTVSDLAGNGEIKVPSTTLFAGGMTRIVSGTLG